MVMARSKLAAVVEAGLCTKDEAARLEQEAVAAGILADMAAICAHVAARGEAAIAAGETAGGFSFRLCQCGLPLAHGKFFKGDECISGQCLTKVEVLGHLEVLVNEEKLTATQAAILFKQAADAGLALDGKEAAKRLHELPPAELEAIMKLVPPPSAAIIIIVEIVGPKTGNKETTPAAEDGKPEATSPADEKKD